MLALVELSLLSGGGDTVLQDVDAHKQLPPPFSAIPVKVSRNERRSIIMHDTIVSLHVV